MEENIKTTNFNFQLSKKLAKYLSPCIQKIDVDKENKVDRITIVCPSNVVAIYKNEDCNALIIVNNDDGFISISLKVPYGEPIVFKRDFCKKIEKIYFDFRDGKMIKHQGIELLGDLSIIDRFKEVDLELDNINDIIYLTKEIDIKKQLEELPPECVQQEIFATVSKITEVWKYILAEYQKVRL